LIRRLAQRGESGAPKPEIIDRMIQLLEDEKNAFK
jgi:hypothetical protein